MLAKQIYRFRDYRVSYFMCQHITELGGQLFCVHSAQNPVDIEGVLIIQPVTTDGITALSDLVDLGHHQRGRPCNTDFVLPWIIFKERADGNWMIADQRAFQSVYLHRRTISVWAEIGASSASTSHRSWNQQIYLSYLPAIGVLAINAGLVGCFKACSLHRFQDIRVFANQQFRRQGNIGIQSKRRH